MPLVGAIVLSGALPAVESPPLPPVSTSATANASPWSAPVSVAQLVAAARATHPTAAAVMAARAAALAHLRQTRTWDNPEVELSLGRNRPHRAEVERDRPFGGSLSQRLEWWSTRNARSAAAQAGLSAAEAEGHVAELALEADVRLAAIAYAAACDAADDAARDAEVSAELARMCALQASAGESDRASVARARLDQTTSALRYEARRRDVATALAVLRTWCDPALPEGLVLREVWSTDDLAPPTTSLGDHPRLRAYAASADAAHARVTAAERARLPDVTVGVFAEREYDQDTYGATLGFALPLWDRQQHAIAAAEAERAQARAAATAERLRLERDLAEAHGALATARAEATALAQHALPAAAEAVALRTAAYHAGEASLTDLLEARRAAVAVHSEWRDARRRSAEAAVRLDQALGRRLTRE